MTTTVPPRKARRGLTALAILGLSAPALAFSPGLPPALVGGAPATERLHVAQSAEAAQLAVRIQQLEEQIRILTGQIDGLTFQLAQMQTLLERMQEDNEFRFQQLEGGAPANPNPAAAGSGGAMPSGVPPQDGQDVAPTIIPEQGVQPLPGEQEFDPMFDEGALPSPGFPVESADPLLGSGQGQTGAVLGHLPVEHPGALDLGYRPDMDSGNPDADAQFAAAFDAVQRGDFAFAEDQFAQFIALYPTNPQAPDAATWLGEALLARGANDEAAEVLLGAYQAAPDSPRAPDLLLRLGIALARAGERDTACRTFAEIPNRFPSLTTAFRDRLEAERAGAECPPA